MPSIKEAAEAYEQPSFHNIAELEEVNVNLDLETRKFKEGTPDEFQSYMANIGGEEYRVPNSVVSQLQEILKVKPEMQTFRVTKKGEGLKTEYTVVSLD